MMFFDVKILVPESFDDHFCSKMIIKLGCRQFMSDKKNAVRSLIYAKA